MRKKLRTNFVAIRGLNRRGPPSAGEASARLRREANMSESLFTPASCIPTNQGIGPPGPHWSHHCRRRASQRLIPGHAYHRSTEALDSGGVVLNRALYLHHNCPSESVCRRLSPGGQPTTFRHLQRPSVERDDNPSYPRPLKPKPARKSQHALPNPLHFLCMK